MEYKESKKFGDIAEAEMLKRIQKKYPTAYIDDNGKANSNWDIWIPEIIAGIEVKMDYKSNETGNILIEVAMNDKLSALSVTKAKYWVFVTGYRYIWITPLEIYRFLEQHPRYHKASFTAKGDNKPKDAYLPKHDVFVKYIHAMSTKEFGWIEMIHSDDILYFDNAMKLIEELKIKLIYL